MLNAKRSWKNDELFLEKAKKAIAGLRDKSCGEDKNLIVDFEIYRFGDLNLKISLVSQSENRVLKILLLILRFIDLVIYRFGDLNLKIPSIPQSQNPAFISS